MGKVQSKPDFGTKRVCHSCHTKFYDLNKDPFNCPKCGTQFALEEYLPKPEQSVVEPVKAAVVTEDVVSDDDEPVIVSLHDAEDDDDTSDDDEIKLADESLDVELDDDLGGADDDAFLEDDEDEDDDVSGLIGGGKRDDDD